MSSGRQIATAGPLGALIAYLLVGVMLFSTCESLSEMASYISISGSFNAYASRFVDPALGFAMGWGYWMNWALILPLQLISASTIIQFWIPSVPTWLCAALLLAILLSINIMGVSLFGETEYWLSFIKVEIND